MRTKKNSMGNKDWRKADARVLGQILAAQNIEFALPDITHIAEYYAETLLTIPGIGACRVCLEYVSVQRGEMELGICTECQASRKRDARQDEQPSHEPDFKCELVKQPGIQFNVIASLHHHFGYFVFQIDDAETFNIYKPFIGNLANYVATSLENRLQKDLLQKARDELERRVEERTDELRASNETIKDLYNNAPCGYHSLDQDGFFILINDTELRWLGYSREEIIGRVKFQNLLTANSLKTFEANFPGFKERGWAFDLECEMVRKEGTLLPVLLNATAITDKNGNYVMSRSTIVDITERKQAEDALQERERHSQSLLRLSRKLEQAQTYAEVLNAARDEVRNAIGYQNLWAYLLSEDKKYFKALIAEGPMSDTVMSEEGTATLTIEGDKMLEEIVQAKGIVVIEDARVDERTNKEIVAQLGNRTIVNIPIILFDQHLGSVGTGTFGEEGVRPPTESEQKYLTALASHMAVTLDRIHLLIERKRAEEALRRLNRELRAISDCNQTLLRAVDEQTLLNDVCRIVCDEAGYRLAWVGYAENDDAKTVRPVAWGGFDGEYVANAKLSWADDTERGCGPGGTAIRSGEIILIQDFATDPRMAPWRESALQCGYRSVIGLPLKDEKANVFGVLLIYSTEINAFTADEIRLLEELAGDLAFGISTLRVHAERKQAEDALRQSEELLRVTLTNISDPVFITDNDGKFTFICPNVLSALGYSMEEIQALGYISKIAGDGLFNPEELEMRGEILNIERLIVDNFGRQRIFLVTVKRVSIGEGTRLYTFHDITERKQAEEALRESETKFRAVFENSVDAIGVSKAGIHTFVNPAYLALFGYADNAELSGKPILDLIAPSHREQILENVRRRASGQPVPVVYETRGLRKDGTEFDMDVHVSTYELNSEVYTVPIMRDITARKQAEQNLRQMNERFSLAARAARLGVWDWDIQKDELVWDDGMYGLYGVKREDFAGAYEAWLKGIHPDDRALSDEISKQAQRGEREYDTEFRVVWPDGSIHYLKALGQFVRAADGAPLRMTGVNFDITERKRTEAEMQALAKFPSENPNPVMRVTQDGVLLYANRASAGLIQGWNCSAGGQLPEFWRRLILEVLESGLPREEEAVCGERVFTLMLAPIVESGYVNLYGRDITEHNKAERALQESEARYRTLFTQAPDAIFLENEQDEILDVNPAACILLGYSREELLSMRVSDLQAPEMREQLGDIVKNELSRHGTTPFESVDIRKDGSRVAIEISDSRMGDSDLVLSIVRDITERKRVEDAMLFVAQRGWQISGENFFDALAQFLGEKLAMDYVLIDRIDENPDMAETVALYAKGAITPNMRYALKGTPCENVMGRQLCVYPHGIQQLFPEDTLLAGMGAESYVGIPLWDSTGQPIGLIAIMGNQPLPDDAPVTQLLQLVATRAAAELERERSDRLLRAREHEFRTLAENSPDVIVRYDREGQRIYVNPEFERVNHLSASQVLGKTPVELSTELAPKADVFTEKLLAAMASGTADKIDLSWTKDGKLICWFVRVVPEFDANGNVVSALTIWSDITERKRAEDALHQSEERFRRLAENARDVIYRMSIPEGKYEYVSPAVLSVFGYSPEECYQTPMLIKQAIHPDWQMYFEEQWANLIKGEIPPTYEYQFIHKSGEIRWLNQRNILVRDNAGNPIAIEGIVTDITKRKQAEMELSRERELLRTLVDNMPEEVYVKDRERRFLLANELVVHALSAHSIDEVIGKRDEDFMPPDLAKQFADEEDEIMRTGKPLIDDENTPPFKPGPNLWYMRTKIPLRDGAGNIIGLAGLGSDITERKLAEEKIHKLNLELEQRVLDRTTELEAANKELEAFAYSVSHDLRAPLRHIDGFLELLQTRTTTTLDEKSQHYMATIADSARRMGVLIDDLLSFSRMGRNEISKAQVDLGELVQDVIREFRPETEGRDIQWNIPPLPLVIGDRAMLRIVLVNLISNALKFTRSRSPAKIEIGWMPDNQTEAIIFFVRDSGVGFDMEYADKLFGVFQRLHRADEFEGTGIGLANVQRIIRRHGGKTWAEGQIDHGATFYFSLPKP